MSAVRLAGGERVATPVVVNAAGPAAGRIARLAGIDLPVVPKKRMTYVFDCRNPPERMPLTIDVSGIATRPEGAQFLAILSPPPEADPEADPADFELDEAPFEETIWPVLAARIPAFEAVKLVRSWAGHYDYNTLDQNAVIGPHPELAGFYFCNGFSGHGVQQSPAAGRAIAELILHGGFRTIDLARFGFQRIAAGRPLAEQNVV
jgi:glycine/D-amino acid oxidase-like deaminating enzyme